MYVYFVTNMVMCYLPLKLIYGTTFNDHIIPEFQQDILNNISAQTNSIKLTM